jgi:SAM-dependent methyltransferase
LSENQVKSKQRVTDHGEVFTAEREVNAMLDLVKQETERIDSRFLEPACGDGNFLAEILRRKLAVVKRKYKKSPIDYEKYAVLAATSIYGVDILQDNVEVCRARMFAIWDEEYQAILKKEVNEDCRAAVRFILSRNIVCGNALTLKTVDVNGKDTEEPIIFSEWSFVTGGLLKRRDFRFDEMLEGRSQQISIFMTDWEYDEETKAFIPKPIKEFKPVHYRRVQKDG